MEVRLGKLTTKKEFVLLRIEKEGVPVYLVTSLLETVDFGGTGLQSSGFPIRGQLFFFGGGGGGSEGGDPPPVKIPRF